MNLSRPVLPVLLALSVAACSGPDVTTLTVTALPPRVEVGSGNFTQIEVRGRIGEDTILYEGSEITVMTDCGTFTQGSNEQMQTLSIQGQKATARLYSPSLPCTANVTGRYVDPYGVEVRATTTVQFAVPAVTRLNFSCTAKNIGAFLTSENMGVLCDATPYDADSKPVRNARVRFLTEAGEFKPFDGEQGEDKEVLFIYEPRTGGREPQDVAPEGDDVSGEPRWTDAADNNRIRNPRDGLATLVAYVESPNDGLQGEPYVDANDNDQYDAGETYEDLNKNGRWDDMQDTHIWKMIKILWTGANWGQPASRVTSSTGEDFNIPRGQQRTLSFRILDRNLNVLAHNGTAGLVEWSNPEGEIFFMSGESTRFGEVNRWGMDIDNNTYKINNRGRASSYMIGASYSVTIRNDNEEVTDDPIPQPKSVPYQVIGTVSRASATDDAGSPSNEVDEVVSAVANGILH